MIYLWDIPDNFLNRDVGEYDKDCSPNRFLLQDGRPLSFDEFTPTPKVYFETPKKRVLTFDCLPNNSMVPLVNGKIKNILEDLAKEDVQFLPAVLQCADGEIHDYYFLNIVHKIIGIDHEKSSYKNVPFSDAIMMFNFLTYKQDCMGNYLLARDEEYSSNLLVNERIKEAFNKENITGVKLVRPEDCYRPLTAADLINEYNRDSKEN